LVGQLPLQVVYLVITLPGHAAKSECLVVGRCQGAGLGLGEFSYLQIFGPIIDNHSSLLVGIAPVLRRDLGAQAVMDHEWAPAAVSQHGGKQWVGAALVQIRVGFAATAGLRLSSRTIAARCTPRCCQANSNALI
jgi:hypothetical protein